VTEQTVFPPDDWRSHSRDFGGDTFRRNLDVVARLDHFAGSRGISLPQLAVAWTIHNPTVDVAIIGARRAGQLEGVAPAADVGLTAEELDTIAAILADAASGAGPAPEECNGRVESPSNRSQR